MKNNFTENRNNKKNTFSSKKKKRYFNNKRPNRPFRFDAPLPQNNQSSNLQQNENQLNKTSFLQKYDVLVQEYLEARKKFFELAPRADVKQKNKLERRYFETLEAIKKWELSLASWQKDLILKKNNPYKLDITYSSNHRHETSEKIVISNEDSQIHLLPTQKIAWANYKEDTEISKGTFEDYLNYKNQKL